MFTLNVNYFRLNYDSIHDILYSILFNYGSVHIYKNSNKLGRVTIESRTTVGLEVGLQPGARSIGTKISHSCRWFPEILLHAVANLAIFLLEVVPLLKYPASAIPWLILSHSSFLLCMVFNSCCTASSLHKAIKSLVSSNHHVSAILFNHAL